jgi:hypothetical protein
MKIPQEFVDDLQNVHKFKNKGIGPIRFHLGMDFIRDNDGTLCLSPIKYIEKLINNNEKLFGEKPKQVVTSHLRNWIIRRQIPQISLIARAFKCTNK